MRTIEAYAGLTVLMTSAVAGMAQSATGTYTDTPSGPDYTYSLTASDASGAGAPMGSFWFAWVPGKFFLPSVPLSATAPSGWTESIVNHSVQFVAGSSADYILPGSSLSGFTFTTVDTPAEIAGDATSQGYPTTPVTTSDAYTGGLFSSSGNTFTFTASSVPEPSTLALGAMGVAGLWLRRKK